MEYHPSSIPYVLGITPRNYFPDFKLERCKKIIEIKPQFKVDIMDDELFSKKQAAEKWCQEIGYTYHILTEKDFPLLTYSQAYADKDVEWIKK